MEELLLLPWEQPGWFDEATAWVHAQLAAHGWQTAGPLELLHQRPWSSFARQATDHGAAYFKAPAPPYYEAPLTQALARWRPECTVPLLAVDLERGWLLSADAGITLRAAGQDITQIAHWEKVLPLYVELQMQMVDRVEELLSFGMYDRRLAIFPHLYADLLEQTGSLRIGLEEGLTEEEYQRLLDMRPQVASWCEELASYGLPGTLTHEEIHEANVLVNGERYLFTDWSDSSVAHPFFTMVVTLRAAAHWLQLPADGAEMIRLKDAYLEPWTSLQTREKLSKAFKLAHRLGMINRALSWYEGSRTLSEENRALNADAVPGWLQDFLHTE